jgi:hypothetical protein
MQISADVWWQTVLIENQFPLMRMDPITFRHEFGIVFQSFRPAHDTVFRVKFVIVSSHPQNPYAHPCHWNRTRVLDGKFFPLAFTSQISCNIPV